LPYNVSITKEEIPLQSWDPPDMKFLTDIRQLEKGNYIIMDEDYDIKTKRRIVSLLSINDGKRYEYINIISTDGFGPPWFTFEIMNNQVFYELDKSGLSSFGYKDLLTGESQKIMEGGDIEWSGGMPWFINPIMNGEFALFTYYDRQNRIYDVKAHTILNIDNANFIGFEGCSTTFRICLILKNVDGTSELFLLSLDNSRLEYIGKLCNPNYSKAFCNNSKYFWGQKFSPDGRITYALDYDPENQNPGMTIRFMETYCLLENNWDLGKCIENMNLSFTFENADDRGCLYTLSWVGDSQDSIFTLFNPVGQGGYSFYCSHEGTWLLSMDGTRQKTIEYPGGFSDRYWLPDNKWGVWVKGDGVNLSTWGLYSPYNGGRIRELGQVKGKNHGVITVE